jgi:hypothetical protein
VIHRCAHHEAEAVCESRGRWYCGVLCVVVKLWRWMVQRKVATNDKQAGADSSRGVE